MECEMKMFTPPPPHSNSEKPCEKFDPAKPTSFNPIVGCILVVLQRISNFFNIIFSEKLKCVIVPVIYKIDRKRDKLIYTNDYIRLSSLELVAHEIYQKNITGETAELGVFRGEFAKHINALFNDRQLYLFDTFEGFDDRDIKVEGEKTQTDKNFVTKTKNVLSDTSVKLVLGKMKFPENCIIKKGYFPGTAKGVEGKFVFVSIDVDLYEPMYQGLCYFYPKLVSGGYIFAHDYNYAGFPGVKNAIKRFSEENHVSYFPLSDMCGSVVFIK
jgi:O-methyltransferase